MYKQTGLPRWMGFNLMGVYMKGHSVGHYNEEDFQMMSDLGFNFVRLPLSYRFWTPDNDPWNIQDEKLTVIDDAVRWGEKYGIHVNICFHRAPGYCIHDYGSPENSEPFDLWKDQEALNCYIYHWTTFAKRYHGESAKNVSFDMTNETSKCSNEDHERVMRAATRAIHEISPDRITIVDGLKGGNIMPVDVADLAKENVGFSCRGYIPSGISHYRAPWVDKKLDFPYPTWPNGLEGEQVWDHERLDKHYSAWAAMAEVYGAGVHCGEGGSNHNCPHDVALVWLDDLLDILKSHNIGYAQWEFTGDFGVIDSNRKDVNYVDYKGHKLDKEMLDILRKYL